MAITTEMVKELRAATGAGVLEAKKALEQHDGDFDKAVDMLREKGAARAAKRADRAAKEGVIELYAHPGNRVGVMLELNSETDFVARNEQFRELAHNLALHIAAASPRYLNVEDVPANELERETSVLKAQALAEGKPEAVAEKMVAGRISKFYEEMCLMEQPYVKDEKVKIKDMLTEAIRQTGENIMIRRFVRYELGEALEN
ncbi:MAG: translation elongation factor Ts [Anaerolineae bacterium]|uniref:translation elongation factor Ts n=1 Tax=Promineifilum sp. TaxID=2664178 RepID=UPI001D6DA2B3|nr:translation elongation factor Ts [Anaerolineales bacterium]MCB8935636.1 translation elongation factor Ts [Promineifilum sp.]MCO5180760.1 translation elongation factor Ts [Promineifilum sp.]MCW5845959.1 translation elongation factor Ts [Anaerolineae bacterium]